ncbi:MalY/PatB family protein [Pseudogracilibacillus sp. SE30717A]|uniref:MalY/PatB family protein n=1 Tax=Pseudogracilibacillus sp. SE30717A TaxID=3098293 RepID=UPI00300E5647
MVDFNTVYDRKHTHSYKWDHLQAVFKTEDVLPMWVADMDFKAPKEVNEALKKRAEHGIYGYTVINDEIQEKVVNWVEKQHDWNINKNWLSFSPGVITSLHIAIQSFTEENDKILLQTPVYTPFFNIIRNGKREVVENSLVFNGEKYEIDFKDFEEKLKLGVKAFILCSPHNPVGRVWTKDELLEMARLCLKYNVLILADEIHADLVFNDYKHIPVASLSEEISKQTITCMSPTKTFNLAGLQASFLVTPDPKKRMIINRDLAQQGFSMLNTMGVIAMEAAYTHGAAWLSELMDVIEDNKKYVRTVLENETNGKLNVIDSEATYLLWIDCKKLNLSDKDLQTFMIEQAKVGLNPGSAYGKDGEHFMRINIACPKETLREGVNRIVQAVNKI